MQVLRKYKSIKYKSILSGFSASASAPLRPRPYLNFVIYFSIYFCAFFGLTACGLRGPLALSPSEKAIGQNQATAPKASPSNLLSDPSATVLNGANGKRITLPVQTPTP